MDESIVQGVLGAEPAIRYCIVIILEFFQQILLYVVFYNVSSLTFGSLR